MHRSGCPLLSCSLTVLRFPSIINRRSGKQSAQGDLIGDFTNRADDSNRTTTSDDERIEDDEVTLIVGVFGDTAGVISVWLLPGSIVPSKVSSTAR